MDYKPQDIFLGVIDLFAILLPGKYAQLAYLYLFAIHQTGQLKAKASPFPHE